MTGVRVGCAGWAYDDWRGPFYSADAPASEFLARYARVFDTVEADSMHYGLPSVETTRKWARAVPQGFQFLPKLPGEFTHEGVLTDPIKWIEKFTEAVEPIRLDRKLGPTLCQLPPSFDRMQRLPALEAFLEAWPKDLPLAVELRHASWWLPATYDLLRSHGVALVWSIYDAAPTPVMATTDWMYVRAIGDRTLTKFDSIQRDRTEELSSVAARIHEAAPRIAYVIVNNHYMGYGPGTAQRFAQLLSLPPIDLEPAKRRPRQLGLRDF